MAGSLSELTVAFPVFCQRQHAAESAFTSREHIIVVSVSGFTFCGRHYQKWVAADIIINVLPTINRCSTVKLWVTFDPRVEFQAGLSGGLRELRWVMWAFLGNSIIIWRPCQQTRKHLHSWGGEGRCMSLQKATYCVWVLFISHMEKGTFWTGSDLTHSHTVLMECGQRLLSGEHKESWLELHAARKQTLKDGFSINYSVDK